MAIKNRLIGLQEVLASLTFKALIQSPRPLLKVDLSMISEVGLRAISLRLSMMAMLFLISCLEFHLRGTDSGDTLKLSIKNAIAESILADYQGQWNQAAFYIVNWLDDLPGSICKSDDSTWAYFEGFDAVYA